MRSNAYKPQDLRIPKKESVKITINGSPQQRTMAKKEFCLILLTIDFSIFSLSFIKITWII